MLENSRRRYAVRPAFRLMGLVAAMVVTLSLVAGPQRASADPPQFCIECNVPGPESCTGKPLTASGCCPLHPICLYAVSSSSGCVAALGVTCI